MIPFLIGFGGSALFGVNLSRAAALEVDGHVAAGLAPSGDDGYSTTAAALSLRYFFGDTFSLRAGLRWRGVSTDVHGHPGQTEHVSDIAVELGIGSRWDFPSFFVGADWLTLGLTLSDVPTPGVWPPHVGPKAAIGFAW